MGTAAEEVVVYTRPGCPFCTLLRRGLRKRGLQFQEINIWQDSAAAAVVRSIANGNETVPTVVVGEWRAVNPSADEVLAAVDAPLAAFNARDLEAIAAGELAPAEVERARNRIETAFVDELQHILGRADRLNLYAYYTGDPGFANADLERYLRLEAGSIAATVRRWLVDAPPVVLSVVPRGRWDLASSMP